MTSLVLLAGALLATIPPPVAAPSAATGCAESAPAPEPEVWYGKTSAVVDAVSITLIAGGLALSGPETKSTGLAGPMVIAGLGGFLLGGPGVHLSNGHVGLGAASLGLRALGTVIGAYVVLARAFKCDPEVAPDIPGCQETSTGDAIAISLPFLAAAAIDDILLAHGTVPRPTAAGPGATITPSVGPSSAALSIVGTF
jgi:hypothetical protein